MSKIEPEENKPVEATESKKQNASEDLSSLSATFEFSSFSDQKLSFSLQENSNQNQTSLSEGNTENLDFSLLNTEKLSFSSEQEESKQKESRPPKRGLLTLPDLNFLKRPVKPLRGFLSSNKESEKDGGKNATLRGFMFNDEETLDSSPTAPLLPSEDTLSFQTPSKESSNQYFSPAEDPSAQSFYYSGSTTNPSFYSLPSPNNLATNRLDQHSPASEATEKVMQSTVSMAVADKIRILTAGGAVSDWVEIALNEFHRNSVDDESISSELDIFNADLKTSKKDTEIE